MSEMRTVADVDAAVEKIRAMAGDAEVAHGAEDGLWSDVLRAIADGTAEDPQAMARAALETVNIDFARWCA